MNSSVTKRPFLMITMLVIAIFFSMGSRAIFSPLMPSLQDEMNFNLSVAGSLFLLVNLVYGVAMLLSGFLSCRIGHGRTIVIALIAIALGLLITALARSISLIAVGMAIIGTGAGMYPPSGIAMINSEISLEYRNTAFSLHEIGPNLALLLAPLFVLTLQPSFGRAGVLLGMSGVCAMGAVAFLCWGGKGSVRGAAPDVQVMKKILRLRGTLLGMVILTTTVAGMQGVYAMLPAYLVEEYTMDQDYVNLVLSLSRIAGIVLLLFTNAIINLLGRRRTMLVILLFSALCTALIGLVRDWVISLVVILQPALLAALFPPLLSSLAEIGEYRYQNLTYALVITTGVSVGGGVVPALFGFLADLGLGWLGFIVIALGMALAALFLLTTPDFGRGRGSEKETTG